MKQTEIYLIVIGIAIGWQSLSLNQLLPYQFSIASLISPTGAQVSVYGFRIKHWIVGLSIGIFGILSYYTQSKKSPLKQICLVMLGTGMFLIVDEYEAVIKFLTTGVYP